MYDHNRRFNRIVYTMSQDGSNLTDAAKYKSVVWRQMAFARKCLQKIHQEEQSWVAMIDTDEFLSYHWYGDDEARWACSRQQELIPSRSINLEDCLENFTAQLKLDEPRRFQLPGPSTTIAEYLHKEMGPSAKHSTVCAMVPVLPISGNEGTTNETATTVPAGFSKQDFFTQRFTQHGKKNNAMPGKGMIDVSRTSLVDYKDSRVHQIGPKPMCGNGNNVDKVRSLVRVNHYSGSLEYFLNRRRGETSRTKEEFDRRNSFQVLGSITEIQG